MKIEYIWDNSQEKIQSVKLTIFCNGCGKKSVYEVSREEILRKKGKKRDLKCFAFFCNHCADMRNKDRQFFINGDFSSLKLKDHVMYKGDFVASKLVRPSVPQSKEINVKKLRKPIVSKPESLVEKITIKDIREIDILRFLDSLNLSTNQWVSYSHILEGMEKFRIYFSQHQKRIDRTEIKIHLSNLVVVLIDRHLLRSQPHNISPRFASVFKLTKRGKEFVRNWNIYEQIINSPSLVESLNYSLSNYNILPHIETNSLLNFMFKCRKDEKMKRVSIDFLEAQLPDLKLYFLQVEKLCNSLESFPIQEHFKSDFDSKLISDLSEIYFHTKLRSYMKKILTKLTQDKLVKEKNNFYRLTLFGQVRFL